MGPRLAGSEAAPASSSRPAVRSRPNGGLFCRMATSRRHRSPRKKPVLTRASAGGEPGEDGSYTVETRERPAPEPEAAAESGIVGILEALKGAGQVGIYRQQPQWARGHLQTLNLAGGESVDFQMLDELQRYWGGGVYQFRPMKQGRFAGASRSFQFDGPTLYQGKPHPKDPAAHVPVTPEVVPNYQQPQPPGYPPAPYGAGYDQQPGAMQRPSPELAMLGGFMERMMMRLDTMEAKLAGPGAAPAQAPDQIDGVLRTLKLAKQINEMMNPAPDEDDYDDEPDEWVPKSPQEAALSMAMKKFDEDPELFGQVFGTKGKPKQQDEAGGPRLVRAGEPAAEAPAAGLTPAQIMAALEKLDAESQAQLVNEIGKGLGPETLAALAGLMGADSAAG